MAHRLSPADRAAAGFLLILLALGSLALWIGVPLGWLWLASKITDTSGSHFLAGILGTPIALVAFGSLLAWINRLYLRVVRSPPLEPRGEDDEPRFVRGPLEPLLIGSLVIAAGVWIFWFLFLAEDPACCSGSIASISFIS